MSVCAQSCLTLCHPMGCSLPGSSDSVIFQARILEWIAFSFSKGSSQPRDWTCVSCIGKQILYHCATRVKKYQSFSHFCLRPRGLQPARLLYPQGSPGKSAGGGCHSLLQGFLLPQGSNSGLLLCRQILYQLSPQGSLLPGQVSSNPLKARLEQKGRGRENSLSLTEFRHWSSPAFWLGFVPRELLFQVFELLPWTAPLTFPAL